MTGDIYSNSRFQLVKRRQYEGIILLALCSDKSNVEVYAKCHFNYWPSSVVLKDDISDLRRSFGVSSGVLHCLNYLTN